MNKELPPGWTLDSKERVNGLFVLIVPTEPYTRYQMVEPDYSKIPPPIYGPNDSPKIPPPPEDIDKIVAEDITKGILIMQDYAIAPIPLDKLTYHGVLSLKLHPITHNPTHIVLEHDSNNVRISLIPFWKPVGNYHLMSPPGGSSTVVYNYSDATQRKRAENRAGPESWMLNLPDQNDKAVAVKSAFNRLQTVINEDRYRIHVFVKDLEDMIFFEETE